MNRNQEAFCAFELDVRWLDDNAFHAVFGRRKVAKYVLGLPRQSTLSVGLGAHKEIDLAVVEDRKFDGDGCPLIP